MRKAFFFLCAGVTVFAGESSVPEVTNQNAFTFYQGFKRLTDKPLVVSKGLAMLCGYPGPGVVEAEKLRTGPHFMTEIHVYANASAEKAIAEKRKPLPVGAVIVKEKLAGDGSVAGIGGMIKRTAGYDSEHGDWEYFYVDKETQFTTGKLRKCADCHATAEQTDHLFSAWKLVK